MITDLSAAKGESDIQDDRMNGLIRGTFETFTNRGSILNVQGFSGAIEIRDSVLKRNMAYIKDVVITEQTQTTEYYTPSTIRYSDFLPKG